MCSWTGLGSSLEPGMLLCWVPSFLWGRGGNCSVKNKHNQKLPRDMPEGTLPLWKAPLQWVLVAQVWNFAIFCGSTKPVNDWGWCMAEWVQYSSCHSAQLIFGAACLAGSFLCQAAVSPEVDESRQLCRPVSDSGVCKWFYFLGAFAPILPMHLDAAPRVPCPHIPQCCPRVCGGTYGCQHAFAVYFGSCFLWPCLSIYCYFVVLFSVYLCFLLSPSSSFHSVSFLHSWKIFYIPGHRDRIPQKGWNELAFF